jgi:hypothetical protein
MSMVGIERVISPHLCDYSLCVVEQQHMEVHLGNRCMCNADILAACLQLLQPLLETPLS